MGFAFAFECPRRPGRVQHRLDGSGVWQQLLSAEPIRERDSGFCARLCGGTAWREAEVIGTFCQERRGGYDGVLLPVLVFRPGGRSWTAPLCQLISDALPGPDHSKLWSDW